MTIYRQRIKKLVPSPVWNLASNSYWNWHNRQRHVLARLTSPTWYDSRRQVRSYKDLHLHKRCFIIGNGPSLRQMDLQHLQHEFTFGLNRIYLLFPELGFTTTYLVSVNELVLEQCAAELANLSLPKFVTWRARPWFKRDPHIVFLDTDYTGPENFTSDMTGRVFEGYTVTYVALQLAYYMGFDEVILIGVDHNFATKGPANQAVVSQGDDLNHFSPNYFGKGFKWQLPDLEGSERAYTLAHQAYTQTGRRVLDATLNGKLTIFPKIDYRSLF